MLIGSVGVLVPLIVHPRYEAARAVLFLIFGVKLVGDGIAVLF